MHWLTYSIEEALASLWRQRGSSVMAVSTIAAAMLIVGGFLILTQNLDRLVARWSAAAEFSIYLRDDITDDQRLALNRLLSASPLVAGREFVPKSEARQRFKRDFPDLAPGIEGLEQNPFPASIEVRLRAQAAATDAVDDLARRVTATGGVADVRFDRRWLARVGAIVGGLRWAGWVLAAILMIAAALTVATVVKLALHARRDEVEIMRLMGAPLGLLRGPFVTEGVLQGGAGAVVALGVLWGFLATLRARYGEALAGLTGARVLDFLSLPTAILFVAGGMALGCAGALIAARRVR